MAWQTWTNVTSSDIILGDHLEELHENLDFLSSDAIATNDGTGRCIGHYLAICSTDNSSWCPTNNTSRASESGAGNSTYCSGFDNLVGQRSGRGSSHWNTAKRL
jgi:hypothetical protein